MSLIDDALKRAQEEAARQEEAHRLARRPWIAPQPPRARSRAGGVAALALSFLLVAAGSAWFVARRRGSAPTKTPVPAVRAEPATSPLSPAPPPSSAPPLENVEVPPPTAIRSAPQAPKTTPGAPARALPPVAAELAPAPVRPARAAPPLPDGKTFVRTVTVPGEDPIELDGIVFSETNPVAVIGGRLLGPGASVGGFEIVKIEENRVTLHGRGVTIFLTPS